MKVIITGGGTGGHLSVAKAFLDEFTNRGFKCVFIGSSGGQDKEYFKKDSSFLKAHFLKTQGVVNKKGFAFFTSIFKQFKAFLEALRILREFKPDFIISVGGYSAAPASFAAVFLRIPLIIHEQNAQIGRLNRVLKNKATIFFSSYLKESPVHFYPTRLEFFQNARVRDDIKKVLFMGGSQGAKAINSFCLSAAESLVRDGIFILHQCGKSDFLRVAREYLELPLKVGILKDGILQSDLEILQKDSNLALLDNLDSSDSSVDVLLFAFSDKMPEILSISDFAVCRAGASSLWELCAGGIPALFVPYPYAAGNHQYYNAKFLEDKGLGFICLEQDLFLEVLQKAIDFTKENIKEISQNLQKECAKDATKQMCNTILEKLQSKKG